MRFSLAVGAAFGFAALAPAQFPMQPFPGTGFGPSGPAVNPNNFMPNIYNPQTQPLSPYLNLLRLSDPATNYYYGVRPGTLGMARGGFGGAPFVAGGGNRAVFFPQLATAPDPLGGGGAGPGDVLPPAGHPVVFGNTMGFFPGPGGQAGGSRAGLSGLGTTRPPMRK